MSKKVILLRPFVFSSPGNAEQKLGTEQKFIPNKDARTGEWIPTEVELPDEVANHDFIKVNFADGCIERPEDTEARVKKEKDIQKKKVEDDSRELRKAEDALNRASGSHAVHQANENDVSRQLNTPVNKLGAEQGEGIDKPIDEKASELELNTPVNKLPAGKGSAKS
jgi:hypothetical protein